VARTGQDRRDAERAYGAGSPNPLFAYKGHVPYRQLARPPEDEALTGPVRVASSLCEVRPNDLVWLDRNGNVRPMRWVQRHGPWLRAGILTFGLLASGVLVAFADGFRAFGIVLLLAYLFVGAIVYWGSVARRALRFTALGRRREAEAMADRLLAHPVMAAGYQRIARLIKARIAVKQGRYGDAVEQYRAIRYSNAPRSRRSAVINRVPEIALYEEIVALCNADRRDDARDLLERAPRPTGDFLELLYDIARLFVSFSFDDPSLVPGRDVQKMMRYNRCVTGWGALALVGWHARKSGREKLARRAIDAERNKLQGDLARRMPAVARWLDQAS
jgi:tetratricopeptide (TPR) repeat protein